MIIGIDGNEANIENRVGVPQYAFEILCGLYRMERQKKNKHKFIIYLKNHPRKDLPRQNSFWRYKVIPGSSFWVLSKLMPYLLINPEPQVLFSPSHYLPPYTRMPRVCTIHDLGYLEYSAQFKRYDFWQLKIWSAISIIVSKCIIAVSNSTKKDIVRHYPFASNKIFIAYHGYDKSRFNNEIEGKDVRRVRKKYGIPKDYLLFLSTLKPSKNIEGIIEAFESLKPHCLKNFKLVIAGKKGWLYKSIFQKVNKLKVENDVIFTDFVSEKDKPGLLAGAKVFVSPSFWEGFGIHVLEAMACGTPVVVSRVASLPEVAGKAGVYVDPNSVKSIAEGIKEVLTKPEKGYNKLVQSGIKQAEKFGWDKSAKKTLEIIEKAGG